MSTGFPFEPMTSQLHIERRDDGGVVDLIDSQAQYWGFYAVPTEARFLRRSGEAWKSVLTKPRLIEARIFNAHDDVHILGNAVAKLWEGPYTGGPTERGGPGWRWRKRSSRLLGKSLREGGWYESAIPSPLVYKGADPNWKFVHLHYREYFERGRLAHVRFLSLEDEGCGYE